MSALPIVITTAGLAKLINAEATGTAPVVLTQVGLTSTAFTPDASMTALPGEFARLNDLPGEAAAPDTIHLVIQDVGDTSYNLFGFGIYDSTGALFAVYGQATAIMGKSAQADLVLAVDILLEPGAATAITFGNTNFLNPPATETTVGVLAIASAADVATGTDNTRAVTSAKLATALAAKQAALGFTPVQQGTGVSQLGNVVKLGWDGTGLRLTIDVTDKGRLALLSDVTAAINGVVNAAPGALDTLKELADALGDDPNFATTITTALAGKQATLGFAPVQQGTGPGQSPAHIISLGWDGTGLRGSINGVDLGYMASVNYVTTAINALVNAAPGALSTLKQLADAIGDDPSFATTMATALAAKASTAYVDSLTPILYGTAAAGARWCPADHFLEQWGEDDTAISSEGVYTVTFPYAFDGVYGFFGQALDPGNASDSTHLQRGTASNTQATFRAQDSAGGSAANAAGIAWRAWGVRSTPPA